MKTEREFMPIDRYYFDFKKCTSGKGWAQVDTSQDASYFGTWANPFDLKVITYAEGDVTIQTIKAWNEENGYQFFGIDALCNDRLKNRFERIGLSEYLH